MTGNLSLEEELLARVVESNHERALFPTDEAPQCSASSRAPAIHRLREGGVVGRKWISYMRDVHPAPLEVGFLHQLSSHTGLVRVDRGVVAAMGAAKGASWVAPPSRSLCGGSLVARGMRCE